MTYVNRPLPSQQYPTSMIYQIQEMKHKYTKMRLYYVNTTGNNNVDVSNVWLMEEENLSPPARSSLI